MTRLVDADALRSWFESHSVYDEFSVGYIMGLIDALPTVEAIPIEWLTAQADNPSNSDKLRNAIDYIVYTLWAERKDNG